ncbi:MAG: PRTRC system ThiF family protein [Chitinophagaceae bacterium]|jgi:PRTRC genetic system ThiF family protein
MNTQKAMHFTENYLINPTNPITVNLIGAGGSGSVMLTALARMNHSLIALGHAGLQVQLFDDDVVTEANLGRQLFASAELGMLKSVCLINRTNLFFGTNWKAVSERFGTKDIRRVSNKSKANIFISCVDTVSARYEIAQAISLMHDRNDRDRSKPFYWMDLGNSRHSGQVVLSTIGEIKQPETKLYKPVPELPMVTEEFKDLLDAQMDNNEPSCSLAEALEKQDLFINPALVNMGASLLWSLFRNGMTEYRGFFMNLKDFRTQPIFVG